MNTLNVSSSLSTQLSTPSSVKQNDNVTNINVADNANHTSSTRVSISAEALEKFEKEQQEIGKKLGEQMIENQADKTETEPQDSEITQLNKLIEEVKEQIKEAQRKLTELQYDKSTQAEETRKLLEAQLLTLTGTLIELIDKKMKAIEKLSG
ncbi:hypothetical protein Q4489_09885 [Thalassotalea sp. 1_MG-2023]|uniref:hypothetical protein n=1 Tax=Thalassotalea sp. 1_MG-2023 TaxID=3062680 RepID=UPI0026E28EC4|nr:hypothetical protein [Thalassotalea sp. 1_MG-2023]MDO6427324.1 hypothetical protein [Thalassotalea sp. 1_MG-2023]